MKSVKTENSRNIGQRWFFLSVMLVVSAFVFVSNPFAPSAALGGWGQPARMVPQDFTGLAKNCSPAVVNISTVRTMSGGAGRVFEHFFRGPQGQQDPFGRYFEEFFKNQPQRQFKQASLGSGFILDKAGYIVTNNHVIDGADEIEVKLTDGKEYRAEIIGTDASTDLALIKIKADHDLPVLAIGDSDKIEIGQWVLAIGSPFGLEHTVTAGIISARGRVIGAGPYDDFIQTDASINPGNSGGPLLNMDGEVVGINTAIVNGGDGIGFAIPINIANAVFEQLKSSGAVTRGWLGVGIQDLDDDLKEYYGVSQGVLISEVFPGDPADRAGIQQGDIVLSINGKSLNSTRDLSRLIADLSVESKAEIVLNRKGKVKTVDVIIARRDEAKLGVTAQGTQPDSADSGLGMQIADITPEVARRFGLTDTDGVIVIEVQAAGKSAAAGIQEGDIIKEINHQPVKNVSGYNRILEGIKKGGSVQLYIKRSDTGMVVVKLTR
ncbi:MAG: DegQ family serine endoprotease [Desulfobacteraceae bacterium]|nr:MAG: DegQ family serine endoprotease [Desulfobacteraceae bacterium]